MDDRDPGLLGLRAGARTCDRLAVERDRAGVRLVDAGEHLEQRRLAGAVLPHQRVHLAGAHVEVDVVQHTHAEERLADARHRQRQAGSNSGVGHAAKASGTSVAAQSKVAGPLPKLSRPAERRCA